MLELEKICRDQGVAFTLQRRVIFEAFLSRRDHPTADEMYEKIQDQHPEISRTTVYRNLEALVKWNQATKVSHPGSAVRYDPIQKKHHHLLCIQCEKLVDLSDDVANAFRVQLPKSYEKKFQVRDFTIYFRGFCSSCQKPRFNPQPKEKTS